MTSPARRHLIVFARAPRYGAVKTRLAAEVGAGAAWRAYRAMTATTLKEVAESPFWTTRLAVTPAAYATRTRFWPNTIPQVPQAGGDLGRRMAHALEAASRDGAAVLVGSDIPDIRAAHVRGALDILRHRDLVFGPATDGGFWLVGVRHRAPAAVVRRLFDGVRWSSATALADTLRNLPRGWRVGYAATLSDIDTAADLAAWRDRA